MTKPNVVAHCPECNDELILGIPIHANVFIQAIKAFHRAHKLTCKEVSMVGPAKEGKH